MFKKIIAAAILLAGIFSMPAKADSNVNWTGLYAGALATYGDGYSRHCNPPNDCQTVFANVGIQGWLFGGTVGYNWQASNWVLGMEADGSWGRVNGSDEGPNFGCNVLCKTDVRSLATLRGRLGYTFDRFLPYVTAGAGWTNLKGASGPPAVGIEDSTERASFVWGGGLEYAFSPQWSVKVEYLRVDLNGVLRYDHVGGCGLQSCEVRNVEYDTVRFGLNYRFGH